MFDRHRRKGRTRRTVQGLLAAGLIFSVSATASCSRYFHDDFDSDTVGAQPAQFPPGNPAGDELQHVEGDGSVTVTSVIIDEDNSLALRGPSAGGAIPTPIVQAKAVPIPAGNQSRPVHAVWQSRLTGVDTRATVYLLVFAPDGIGVAVCTVIFEEGIIYLNGNSIGGYDNGAHAIHLTYFPDGDRCEAIKTGSGNASGPGSETAQADPFHKEEYRLEFVLTQGDASANAFYVDSVEIYQFGN